MNPEELLKRVRLEVPAEVLRGRVLKAARRARFEQRLWRWTWGVAAAVLAVAVPVNIWLGNGETWTPDSRETRQVDVLVKTLGMEELRKPLTARITFRPSLGRRKELRDVKF